MARDQDHEGEVPVDVDPLLDQTDNALVALNRVVKVLGGLDTLDPGQLSVTTVEVAVPVTVNCKTVALKALAANAAPIYIGKTGVLATTGWELSAGDSVEVDVSDEVQLFAIAESGTQRLCYWVVA